jgi:hypothetical protein
VQKQFADHYEGRRFYAAKSKQGKNPHVIGEAAPMVPAPHTKLVAAYVRVSTVGQNEAGQRAEIQKWLTGTGVNADLVRWYVDKKSGDNLKRPEFERLQKDLFHGEIGTIVVWMSAAV